MTAGNEHELIAWQQQLLVLGIDEAGRGPIAGPLVVAGCILPIGFTLEGLYDSKAVSEKRRNQLFGLIVDQAVWYCVLVKDAAFVDKHNIYQATKLAMQEIVSMAKSKMGVVLSDAMPLAVDVPCTPLIKGDQKSISIAAASILAKVVRDDIMVGYDVLYPQFGFAAHKGYPTKLHLDALEYHGSCGIHRQSYRPVAELNQMRLF